MIFSIRKKILPMIPAAALLVLCLYAAIVKTYAAEQSYTVIMYHHVVTERSRVNDYCVMLSDFERDLQYLKSHGYNCVTADDIISADRGEKTLPERAFMLTFDDAQESFYAYALPLIKKYGFSAVLAVVGEFADEYTQNDCHELAYSYCGWDEIAEMSREGTVEIANHTNAFHSLSPRRGCGRLYGESDEHYASALCSDLSAAQQKIFSATGKTPRIFVYPYGIVSKGSGDVIKKLGFTLAFTCEERKNIIKGGDLFNIGRYNRKGGLRTEEFFARAGMD